jgi:hypothetical protein
VIPPSRTERHRNPFDANDNNLYLAEHRTLSHCSRYCQPESTNGIGANATSIARERPEGHDVGDTLIKDLAELLRGMLAESDILARIRGR